MENPASWRLTSKRMMAGGSLLVAIGGLLSFEF